MKVRGFVVVRATGEPLAGVRVAARTESGSAEVTLTVLASDENGYVSDEESVRIEAGAGL